MPASNLYLGLDVHKDSVTSAVFVGRAAEPERDQLPNDPHEPHPATPASGLTG